MEHPTCLRLTPDLVARLPCSIPDPGPMNRPAVDFCAVKTADCVLSRLEEGEPLWVFAFGSILWKRRFAVAEERAARAG